MKETIFQIGEIPAVLYGEESDRIYLFIHGKCGNKEEAESLAEIVCPQGIQVLGIDLPEHGARKNSTKKAVPWDVVPELQDVLRFAEQRRKHVLLCAVSIGAYFSLLAFSEYRFEKCLFVSPILDMSALIEKMMESASVSAERLQAEKEVCTSYGEPLSWEYYEYAKHHPILEWNSPTAILYAGHDELTDRESVLDFANRFGCSLRIYEDGEHWFHTVEQLNVLRAWIREQATDHRPLWIKIRCAEQADIPDWLNLVNTVASDFPGLDMEDYTKTLIKNVGRKTALCAYIGDSLAGILLFSPKLHTLSCMAVHPKYRRLGAASLLISEMLRRMPSGDISVTTFREDDPKGIAPRALYQTFGFLPEELFTEFDYPVQRFVLHRSK